VAKGSPDCGVLKIGLSMFERFMERLRYFSSKSLMFSRAATIGFLPQLLPSRRSGDAAGPCGLSEGKKTEDGEMIPFRRASACRETVKFPVVPNLLYGLFDLKRASESWREPACGAPIGVRRFAPNPDANEITRETGAPSPPRVYDTSV